MRFRIFAISFILLSACQVSHPRAETTRDRTFASAPENMTGPLIDLGTQILINRERVQENLMILNSKYEQLFQTGNDLKIALQRPFDVNSPNEKQRNLDFRAAYARIQADQQKDLLLKRSLGPLTSESARTVPDLAGSIVASAPIDHHLAIGIKLLRETPLKVKGTIAGLGDSVKEICWNKEGLAHSPLDVFASVNSLNASCIHPTDRAHLIVSPRDGLQEKLIMLTGSRIPDEIFTTGDFEHALDFSHAPQFDQIFVSTLEIKPDLTGNLITQALLYQATHGAQVRLIIPDLPQLGPLNKKDILFVKNFARRSPNIQVQFYRYSLGNPDITNAYLRLERVIHAKIFVGLSIHHPELDTVIMGGRNLRDGFYIEHPPQYSLRPDLVQYDESKYLFYRDLEVQLNDAAIAKQIANQYMALWMRDMTGPSLPLVSFPIPTQVWTPEFEMHFRDTLKTTTWVRSFISTPWADNRHELEELYAQMVDSAQRTIRITSPYVRPTPSLRDALARAASRGVLIQFISDLDFSRDNVPKTTHTGNIETFNDWLKTNKKIKEDPNISGKMSPLQIYDWQEGFPSILHAKSLLVDEELLYIGSANVAEHPLTKILNPGYSS